MSHSVQIHKSFYEIKKSVADITGVSKLLEEAGGQSKSSNNSYKILEAEKSSTPDEDVLSCASSDSWTSTGNIRLIIFFFIRFLCPLLEVFIFRLI